VAAAVDTGEALLDALDAHQHAHQPDVAVVDVRLPPTFTDEGLRAAIEARRRRPGFPVLILPSTSSSSMRASCSRMVRAEWATCSRTA
jgi:CheY-like chemotaxis protein